MEVKVLVDTLCRLGADYYTGVPDSLLQPFCNYLLNAYGISDRHIVAANEGAAVGLAAGHYLATGKPGVVYMQNSGIGNAINPICSLLHQKVYGIPAIFVIGWRGEPGVKDEPQHIFQGESTLAMLECLQIPYKVLDKDTILAEEDITAFDNHLQDGQSVAFVVKKAALISDLDKKSVECWPDAMMREHIVEVVVDHSRPSDVFVCTTGKLSREMYEIRDERGEKHHQDFLTVGSMGHSLMIAMGIAQAQEQRKVFCLDGDGAAIMHLGSLAVAGVHHPPNLVHIVINNGVHETVGGMPVVSNRLNLCEIAKSLGYANAYRVADEASLIDALNEADKQSGPVFIEAISNTSCRANLGRPTTSPQENKKAFMRYLAGELL